MNQVVNATSGIAQSSESTMARVARNGSIRVRQGFPVLTRRPPQASVPLSFAQQQIWLHAQLAPSVPLYNEALILEHIGPLDLKALEQSYHKITQSHEILRTRLPVIDGSPMQV